MILKYMNTNDMHKDKRLYTNIQHYDFKRKYYCFKKCIFVSEISFIYISCL